VDPVALTFDDGPDATWTPIILRELDRLRARATFFVMGPLARAHPAVVRAMGDRGHCVELHCGRHLRHSACDRQEVEDDTDGALDALAALGVHPTRWRTPWGDTAPWSSEVAAQRGLTLTGWTLDSHDWRGDPAERMMDAIRPGVRPGAVVLLHDGLGPGARRQDCLQTMRLLAPLCGRIRELGLDPAALAAATERAS
jgi:peptidoglycan/xylan/chitin deacetylase (PgdA/CDA1 family)